MSVAQLALVIAFGALIVPAMPALAAPLVQHVAFYESHDAVLAAVNYFGLATIVLFLVFAGGIFSMMRRSEGQIGVPTVIAVGSAIALAAARLAAA